jgi:c-di-GMP-binding flagellar brake protein YcgR
MVNSDIFKPGLPVVLESAEIPKTKLTSYIRGVKDQDYLIIDHPKLNGRLVPMSEDSSCIVRFIHQGKVIGFRSKVESTLLRPRALIFLQFPEEIETAKLRKSDRYPVQLEAWCATEKRNGRPPTDHRDHVLNISQGGCMVAVRDDYPMGGKVYLTVLLPELPPVNDLPTIVKRSVRKKDFFEIGLEFVDHSEPAYHKIQSFLNVLATFRVEI